MLTAEPHVLLAQRHGRLTKLDIQDELAAYSMPGIQQGEMVLYYPEAVPNSRADIAFVSRHFDGGQTIAQLYVPLGDFTAAESVPHVSDPNLKLGGAHLEAGAWDYTQKYKDEMAFRDEIRQRLVPTAPLDSQQPRQQPHHKRKSKPAEKSEYQKLLERGKELGIPAIPKLSTEELKRRIKLTESPEPQAVGHE